MQQRIDQAREHIADYEAQREAAQALPRRQRQEALIRLDAFEAHSLRALSRLEGEMQEVPAVGDAARRELVIAEHVLAERRELVITAARVAPPVYVRAELGERPSDTAKRQTWDRGVGQIERYRQQHGVTDPSRAFGQEAKRGAERARQQAAMRRLQELQRALGLGRHAARARDLGRGLGIGR